MPTDQIKAQQKQRRAQCLQAILCSKTSRKLIVAGAGTGKTFTFGEVLKGKTGGNNLALTFIRKLAAEMETALGENADAKTFHSYCKRILHTQNGKVEIAPFLTKLVEKDAELLGRELSDFDAKFQTLDEASPEVGFHIKRGDYYDAVGFDDSVYRLYKLIQNDSDVLPSFDQIVIDEFQDFNPLEVAFISELSKKGDILIVGDDDQAVYDNRNASPNHLRAIFKSAGYDKFALPFCSRCPQAIVDVTNRIIQRAQAAGYFKNRIPKDYECYLEDKEQDSIKYPKIVLASCTTAAVVAKYVHHEISKINPQDIAESHTDGKQYPTVLIVGTKQYLREVDKHLKKAGVLFDYTPSDEVSYGIVEAYEWLLRDSKSNLGWRILVELFLDEAEQKRVVETSEQGVNIVPLLDAKFVANHLRAIELFQTIEKKEQALAAVEAELRITLAAHFDEAASRFSPKEDEEEAETDKTKPTILLTSFKGCKGLSAGHVFLVGVHNGSLPKAANAIKDVEIAQFIVALTRTRKQCHIVSNEWLVAPKNKKGEWVQKFQKSTLVAWIPAELAEDKGNIKAGSFK